MSSLLVSVVAGMLAVQAPAGSAAPSGPSVGPAPTAASAPAANPPAVIHGTPDSGGAITVQPITGAGGAKGSASSGGDLTFLFVITGVLLFMIIFSMLAGRKEKKARAQMLASIGSNDRVQTVGGIIGTIVEIRDEEVVLRVDENTNTRIRFSKAAVQQVLRKADGSVPGQQPAKSAAQAEGKPNGAKVPA